MPSTNIGATAIVIAATQLAQLGTYTSTRQWHTTTITITATGITIETQLLTTLVQTPRLYTMTTSANLTPPLLITATNYATITITKTAAPPTAKPQPHSYHTTATRTVT